KGMPSFDFNDSELEAIVAFIHDQKTKAESVGGGRRSVDVSDLETGDVEAGRRDFNGAGGCSNCHSSLGDLAGVANRFRGLPLVERMLYPPSVRTQDTVKRSSEEIAAGLNAHFDLLGKYTDDDMHNVYGYLQTLR